MDEKELKMAGTLLLRLMRDAAEEERRPVPERVAAEHDQRLEQFVSEFENQLIKENARALTFLKGYRA